MPVITDCIDAIDEGRFVDERQQPLCGRLAREEWIQKTYEHPIRENSLQAPLMVKRTLYGFSTLGEREEALSWNEYKMVMRRRMRSSMLLMVDREEYSQDRLGIPLFNCQMLNIPLTQEGFATRPFVEFFRSEWGMEPVAEHPRSWTYIKGTMVGGETVIAPAPCMATVQQQSRMDEYVMKIRDGYSRSQLEGHLVFFQLVPL